MTNVISPIANLLLNMSGGLLPENLTKDECDLLKVIYGKDWFTKLGYTAPTFNLPKY